MNSVTNDTVPIVESSIAVVDGQSPLPSPSIGVLASLRHLWTNYYPPYNHCLPHLFRPMASLSKMNSVTNDTVLAVVESSLTVVVDEPSISVALPSPSTNFLSQPMASLRNLWTEAFGEESSSISLLSRPMASLRNLSTEAFGEETSLMSPSISLLSRPMASLRNLWTKAFGEESSLMSNFDLNFTIVGFFALIGFKAQGNAFPFQTNPRTMRVIVSSLIMFALASTAKHAFSVRRNAPTSVYAIVARFGRMLSVVILNQGAKDSDMTPPTTTTDLCAAE